MKLKDLPINTTTNKVVLYMPKKIFDTIKNTGLNTQRIIVYSLFSSPTGFWVKTEPSHAKKMNWNKNRVFPISSFSAIIVLEWRVIKVLKS